MTMADCLITLIFLCTSIVVVRVLRLVGVLRIEFSCLKIQKDNQQGKCVRFYDCLIKSGYIIWLNKTVIDLVKLTLSENLGKSHIFAMKIPCNDNVM